MALQQSFETYWTQILGLPRNVCVLLAVSGGCDSMTLARLRGVTYETLSENSLTTRLLPAIYTRSWSIQSSDSVIDFSTATATIAQMQHVKET